MSLDPLQGVSTVLSLVRASKTMVNTIQSFSHAPEHARRLRNDLEAFQIVLSQLGRGLAIPRVSNAIPPYLTKRILDECSETVTALETAISQLGGTNGLSFARVKAPILEAQCNKYRRRLMEHTGTLGTLLFAVNQTIRLVFLLPYCYVAKSHYLEYRSGINGVTPFSIVVSNDTPNSSNDCQEQRRQGCLLRR